jgi:hypothetical protein
MTTILRIEHPVSDFGRWRKAFDADPLGRDAHGVRRYRMMRATDDRNHVLIDLEFDDASSAEAMLVALRALWGGIEVISDPQARIVELVDDQALAGSA